MTLAALAVGLIGALASYALAGAETTHSILLNASTALGPVLTDDQHYTLYVRTSDAVDPTGCVTVQACLSVWPPLQAPSDGVAVMGGPGVTASIGTMTQQSPGGSITQLTYNGRPLYRYSGDSGPGDVKGAGIGGIWLPAAP